MPSVSGFSMNYILNNCQFFSMPALCLCVEQLSRRYQTSSDSNIGHTLNVKLNDQSW